MNEVKKTSFADKLRDLIIRLVNARYSVPAWLWASSSAAIGLIVTILSFMHSDQAQQFLDALIIGQFWGPLVFLCSVIAMYGMAKLHFRVVRWASFVNFGLWVFGSIAFYITGGLLNLVIFVGQMLIFWAYKYLASYVRINHRV